MDREERIQERTRLILKHWSEAEELFYSLEQDYEKGRPMPCHNILLPSVREKFNVGQDTALEIIRVTEYMYEDELREMNYPLPN